MNKYFCKLPFYQIEIEPHGTAKVCCKMLQNNIKDDNGNDFNLNKSSISDVWNSKWLGDFRDRCTTEEKRPECKLCWDDEEAGGFSFRQQQMYIPVKLEKPELYELVLKLSNKCNCACRICSWYLSSLWQSEWEKTGRFDKNKQVWFIEGNEGEKTNESNWEDWKEYLRKIHHLSLYGGEPLINEEVHKILDFLIEEDLAYRVELGLNTNGTVINPTIIDKLSKFKSVMLHFSIDDVGERYEYERWPAKSNSVLSDLQDLHDNYNLDPKKFTVLLYTTMSVFNVLHMDEILLAFSKLPKFKINPENILHVPEILTLYNMPESIKDSVAKRIQEQDWGTPALNRFDVTHFKNTFINFMYLNKSPYSKSEYVEKMNELLDIDDKRRNQNWKTTFSALYDLLSGVDEAKVVELTEKLPTRQLQSHVVGAITDLGWNQTDVSKFVTITEDYPCSMLIPPFDYYALANLVKSLPENSTIIDIGTAFGGTTKFLAEQAPQSNIIACDGYMASYDKDWTSAMEHTYDRKYSYESTKEFLKDLSNVEVKYGRSPSVFKNWTDPVDMIFEDGAHTYNGLTLNLEFWNLYLKDGGIFSGNAFVNAFPDVERAVNDFREKYYPTSKLYLVGKIWFFYKN